MQQWDQNGTKFIQSFVHNKFRRLCLAQEKELKEKGTTKKLDLKDLRIKMTF